MQRDTNRRGFTISHQKVALEIDFAGCIRGYTDITIIPTTGELKTIYLHCRQCEIETVTVASHKAEFLHHDPLVSLTVSNPEDCHVYPEMKRKLFSALMECDEGELAIGIPGQVSLKQSDVTIRMHTVSESGHAPVPIAPIPPAEFAPLSVHIEYNLRRPVDGIQFNVPTDANPYRVPHVFTTPSSPDAARCWVPCLDSPCEKCTWEFEFVVVKRLEEGDQERARRRASGTLEEDAQFLEDEYPTVVVCSGDLVEQVTHPFSSNKTIFLFSLPVLTSAQHIAFAAGPFHVLSLPVESTGSSTEQTVSQPQIHAFCLPGMESALTFSTTSLRNAMTFYTDLGQYPYSSYKVVFVDECGVQHFDAATMSIMTSDLLHERDSIDQIYETRPVLWHALACQWCGIHITPKAYSDIWLVNGIALYMAGLFLRKHFGANEYRFRIYKDMERVLMRDVGSMPPVCQPELHEPPDPANIGFIHLKAPLILHILDRKLGKSGTSLGLSRALPKIFLSAISGDMTGNALSTYSFLRTCRKVSGVDLRTFADQWIYGSGCPRFGFSASFNRKRMAVELTMKQECPAYLHNEHDPIALALLKPVAFFDGQMTIRIHEADGTPYEHVLDLHTPFKRFEVPFNTKYKRVRRNTKRFLARQAAAAAAAQGDLEAAEAIGMIDMGFGLEVWEDAKERENWKVADWTEEDEQIMSGAVYEWIRLDADFEWIASINYDQPDYMWVSQLQRDRDVVAQYQAVNALSRQPSLIVSSTLTKTALVSNYFFRIRVEAILALVSCALRRLDFIGLFHMFKMFLRYCYNNEESNQELFLHKYVPRPNDFSDLADYFVRRGIITAISLVRLENGKAPPVVRQFLVDQLKYNDNTNNPYADALYICNIISALATALVPNSPPERGELTGEAVSEINEEDKELLNQAVSEVTRYRNMDRLVPSAHNVVTIAALEFHTIMSLANLVPHDCKPFLACSREGNFTQVRIAGFDGLLLSKWYSPKVMKYMFTVIMHDSSVTVRRRVARGICESLALLFSVGEIKSVSKEGESVLIEEDSAAPERPLEIKRNDPKAMVKSLQKDKEIGKNEFLRSGLMPLLLSPTVDYEVRWMMLKLAEMTLRPGDEALPKVVIHLPATPIAEQAPTLPLILNKPKILPQKLSRPPAKELSLPPVPAKIRLPSTTPRTPSSTTISSHTILHSLPSRSSTQPLLVKKKPKVQIKTQPRGMSDNDLRACRSALKHLLSHKSSFLFRLPVDPVRDRAPDYFDVIKSPMDLSTMRAKLESGAYVNRAKFESDFRLMIANAKEYNASVSYAYKEANALNAIFEKRWVKILKTLERAEQSRKLVSTPAEIDVDDAIADAIDLDKKDETHLPTTQAITPKLKIKLGTSPVASSSISIKPPKKLPKSSPNKQTTSRPDKQTTSRPADSRRDSPDDFLLQEVIALERRSPNPAPRHTPLPSRNDGGKPNIHSNIKPTIKVKPPESSVVGKETVQNHDETSAKKQSSKFMVSGINLRRAREILKALRKLPEAKIFDRPVDPEKDGCPTYYEEIKDPMDFGTISSNLDKGLYATWEEFSYHVELVLKNCRQFNPPTTYPRDCADAIEKAWRREQAKVNEKKLSGIEKRALQGLMTKVMKENDLVFYFREPVDPVLLGIPDYHKVVSKKDARDLRTIRNKLDGDKYDSVDGFEADIQLMVDNAIKFNGYGSDVANKAEGLLARVKDMLVPVRQGALKRRKEEGELEGPSVKKQKIK